MKNVLLMFYNKTQGFSLITTLCILTILGVSAVILSTNLSITHKITGNFNDQLIAKQAADAAIAEARIFIQAQAVNTSSLPTSCGFPSSTKIQNSAFSTDGYATQAATWWSNNGCSAVNYPANTTTPPMYVIKYLGCDNMNNAFVYQIIARGNGKLASTVAHAELTLPLYAGGRSPAGNNASTPGAYLATLNKPGCPYDSRPSNEYAYLTPGTSFGAFQGGWGHCQSDFGWCNQGVGGLSFCERNCAGQIRVGGYSGSDLPVPCQIKYGDWVTPGAGVSSITIRAYDSWNRVFKNYTWTCR